MADPDASHLKDIGSLATWSVSSSKPGFGVEHLLDPNRKTLWQSEGPQPHLINIQFSKKQSVSEIWIFADVGLDDSYTPQKISLRAGTFHGDLQEIRYVELDQPTGWQLLKLSDSGNKTEMNELDHEGDDDDEDEPIRAHLLQIAVISNHLNGKDTHVRGVRVFAPRQPQLTDDGLMPFTSLIFQQHQTIR